MTNSLFWISGAAVAAVFGLIAFFKLRPAVAPTETQPAEELPADPP